MSAGPALGGVGRPTARAAGPARTAPAGLLGRAFRPFFLGAAIQAALTVPLWIAIWLGALAPPAWLTPMAWHGHEMVFGFVAAAIAGFLLTASPVWSGGPALVGRPLLALFGLWLAGRIGFATAGAWPAAWLAAVDGAFLPAVALAVFRTLRGSGQVRNHAIVVVVLALAAANAAMHAEALGVAAGVAAPALRMAVDFVVVLILVIGGRIVPPFTRNALVRAGIDAAVRVRPGWSAGAVAAAAALAVATPLVGRGLVTGVLAASAGLATIVRGLGWRTAATRHDALVWSLHAGSAWVAVGLLLGAAHDLGAPVPASAGLHALTVGAMGGMILAVATRVGLGHTGRPLVLPAGVVACFWLVHAAAVARVLSAFSVFFPFSFPIAGAGGQRLLLVVAAAAWSAAFGLFALRYARILTTPRPDGQPG